MVSEVQKATKVMKWIAIIFFVVICGAGLTAGLSGSGKGGGSIDTQQVDSGPSEPSPF